MGGEAVRRLHAVLVPVCAQRGQRERGPGDAAVSSCSAKLFCTGAACCVACASYAAAIGEQARAWESRGGEGVGVRVGLC